MASIAEELKNQGNVAFAAKRFEDAVVMYDKAIEADPSNYIFYNNRAAAKHELAQYDASIADAKKAIELHENIKSHLRIGASLWAQKRYRAAHEEFERALSIDPTNASARDGLKKLSNLLRPVPPPTYNTGEGSIPAPAQIGGEVEVAETGKVGLAVSLLMMVMAPVFFLACSFSPRSAASMWSALLMLNMIHQLLVMHSRGLLNVSGLRQLTDNYCTLSLALSLALYISRASPVSMLPVVWGLQCANELLSRRGELILILGPFYRFYQQYEMMLMSKRQAILLAASTFEAVIPMAVMFNGGAMATLLYLQYIRRRYKRDAYVQLAFQGMRMNITRLTTASMVPPIINTYAQKFFDTLATIGSQ